MTDAQFQFVARSEDDTATFGLALAAALPAGCVIGLSGTLGAGKTRLVQAVAEALGIDRRDVISPTFVLEQQYTGPQQLGSRKIHHLDAYRLRDEDEFLQLGIDEQFDQDVLVFIEWAERVAACLPAERIEIEIEVAGDHERRILLTARGARYASIVERLRAALPATG